MRCIVGSIRRYGTGARFVQVPCTAFLGSRIHYKSDCTYDIDLLDCPYFPDWYQQMNFPDQTMIDVPTLEILLSPIVLGAPVFLGD